MGGSAVSGESSLYIVLRVPLVVVRYDVSSKIEQQILRIAGLPQASSFQGQVEFERLQEQGCSHSGLYGSLPRIYFVELTTKCTTKRKRS